MFGCKQLVVPRSIPPVFLRENHLPLHVMPYGYKGGKAADFLGNYLIAGRDKLKSSHNEQSNTKKYKQSILKAN